MLDRSFASRLRPFNFVMFLSNPLHPHTPHPAQPSRLKELGDGKNVSRVDVNGSRFPQLARLASLPPSPTHLHCCLEIIQREVGEDFVQQFKRKTFEPAGRRFPL